MVLTIHIDNEDFRVKVEEIKICGFIADDINEYWQDEGQVVFKLSRPDELYGSLCTELVLTKKESEKYWSPCLTIDLHLHDLGGQAKTTLPLLKEYATLASLLHQSCFMHEEWIVETGISPQPQTIEDRSLLCTAKYVCDDPDMWLTYPIEAYNAVRDMAEHFGKGVMEYYGAI